MKTITLAALAASTLAGCATSHSPVLAGAASPCRATAVSGHVGAVLTPKLQAAMKKASGAKTVRVIRPGEMVTMDYRTDRLDVEVNDAGKIARVRCG